LDAINRLKALVLYRTLKG